jgi:hypothetical protein
VQNKPGVWFIIQQMSTGNTIQVEENAGVYPQELSDEEAQLVSSRLAIPEQLDRLQAAQWHWVQSVLLKTPWEELYTVQEIPQFVWQDVAYDHIGLRTDVLFKNVPRTHDS